MDVDGGKIEWKMGGLWDRGGSVVVSCHNVTPTDFGSWSHCNPTDSKIDGQVRLFYLGCGMVVVWLGGWDVVWHGCLCVWWEGWLG